ncbi:MAG: sugar transferase [Lachnospiraceae bacterium]|nr:sugar transferase [Lachnospiraceae bacterium]
MSRIRKHDLPLRVVKLLNLLLMTVIFAGSWYMYYSDRAFVQYYNKGNYLIILIFTILYFLLGRVYEAFQISHFRISEMIYSQSLAAVISDAIMYVIICLLTLDAPNILPLMMTFICQLLISICWSFLSHRWYFSTFMPRRTAVVYDVREGLEKLVDEYGMDVKFNVVKTQYVKECIEDLDSLNDCEVVFISGVHSHDRNIILKHCMYHAISVYVIPRVGDVIMSGAKKMHMFHLPILRVDRYSPNIEYIFVKRVFDIIVSLCALILVSPVMLITAAAIKAVDHGPVFYKQCRLTKNGKKFYVMKFRSMYVDAEKDGIARLSTGENDSRITPVGKVIRKIRIDELPQLFNILKGDMSIVGPRPERPEIAEQYEKEMPEFALRLQAKAGLTGYAQVYGKYNTTPYDKLQMDLMYIAHPNFLEDLRICFATIKILFEPESTEGISEGMITAMEIAGQEAAAAAVGNQQKSG